MTWPSNAGVPADTQVQERARAERYAILSRQCSRRGVMHLLTGHHEGDQLETVIFRLSRNSGLTGLQGMREERSLDDGSSLLHVRPLLGARKTQLIEYCHRGNITWVEDPTNESPKYLRNRVRAALGRLHQQDTELSDGVESAARFLAGQGKLLSEATASAASKCIRLNSSFGTVEVDCSEVKIQPVPAARALASSVLQSVSGKAAVVGDQAVARVVNLMWQAERTQESPSVSVAGCLVTGSANQSLRFVRQPPSKTDNASHCIELPPQGLWWDRRFRLKPLVSRSPLFVRALTKKDQRLLSLSGAAWKKLTRGSGSALYSVPVVLDEHGCILCVPTLGYRSCGVVEAQWQPAAPWLA